ncbi:hypothetical protein NXX68_00125 [Bacteroides fragilis]|nr:hypothetical protein [Bacteroides fragilis]
MNQEIDKGGFLADGTPWNDPLGLKKSGAQWCEYIPELFQLFDVEDTRRDATFQLLIKKIKMVI